MTEAEQMLAFGEDLRRQRVALAVSQDALALAAQVSTATVSRWEHGLTAITVYQLRRVKAFLKERTAQQPARAEVCR